MRCRLTGTSTAIPALNVLYVSPRRGAPTDSGLRFFESRSTFESCVALSEAQISTSSVKSANADAGASSARPAAMIAVARLPVAPAAGCKDPRAEGAVRDGMSKNYRPEVAAATIHQPIGDAGKQTGEPERMFRREERGG